jgi:hypothetical protein
VHQLAGAQARLNEERSALARLQQRVFRCFHAYEKALRRVTRLERRCARLSASGTPVPVSPASPSQGDQLMSLPDQPDVIDAAEAVLARLIDAARKDGPLYARAPKAVAQVSRNAKWLGNALAVLRRALAGPATPEEGGRS